MSNILLIPAALAAGLLGWAVLALLHRLELSFAKHPSITGHARMAKRIARLIPGYRYDEQHWYRVDDAADEVVARRRAALEHLGQALRAASPRTLEFSERSKSLISDLRFVGNYRIPFQFRDELQKHVQIGSYWQSSDGVYITDLDGRRFMDLTGSYGVNLFGLDFYKETIAEGCDTARDLGPLLGGYHPCVLDNAQRLLALAGKDEVSFHMSGTEAVMQAVRLARYHTGRRRLVRFSGAYHGWWDDVQPGPGNPMPPSRDTLTLREMHQATLKVLRSRRDIACVLVNPLQAMHPNRAAPTDSTLIDGARTVAYDRAAYTAWLVALREACSANGIVLIFDEVFLGFRLAPGGAQQYFGVRADLVTYGKTLGGGLPVGVLCGAAALMKRYRDERPADLCFARGTFNAHPYVMGAMNAFLKRLERPEVLQQYSNVDALWDGRRDQLNQRLSASSLPLRVANMGTIWVVTYQQPSRYHWLLQFYLRRAGIALSWVGTGRLIFNLNFTDRDFTDFSDRFVAAGEAMQADGWWWLAPGQTAKQMRKRVLREMINRRLA